MKAGVEKASANMDSRFRGNNGLLVNSLLLDI